MCESFLHKYRYMFWIKILCSFCDNLFLYCCCCACVLVVSALCHYDWSIVVFVWFFLARTSVLFCGNLFVCFFLYFCVCLSLVVSTGAVDWLEVPVSGNSRLWRDILSVKWNVKHYILTYFYWCRKQKRSWRTSCKERRRSRRFGVRRWRSRSWREESRLKWKKKKLQERRRNWLPLYVVRPRPRRTAWSSLLREIGTYESCSVRILPLLYKLSHQCSGYSICSPFVRLVWILLGFVCVYFRQGLLCICHSQLGEMCHCPSHLQEVP